MKILLISALAALAAPDERGLEITWVDVEGGAATLIVAPSGESLLVDTGFPGKGDRDARRIVAAMKELKIRRIDHYLTTHWHLDHFGGIGALAKMVEVGNYYDHGFPEGKHGDINPDLKATYLDLTSKKASTRLRPGGTIPLKGVTVRVVVAHGLVEGDTADTPQIKACPTHPAKAEDKSDNAKSVGFVLTLGDFDFLDLGDLTWNVEHRLICPGNKIGKVDVYQVTHHGLDTSNHPALLAAVEPTVAVMNNGATKGGKPDVYTRLKAVSSIKDVFQVHRAVKSGPELNAPPEFVANDEAKCEGHVVRLSVTPDGKQYTVAVPSKGTKRTYASR